MPLVGVFLTVPAGANHQVLLTANAQVTCTATCSPGPGSSTVGYQLVEELGPGNFLPLSPRYEATMSTGNASLPVAVSVVEVASPGAHTYKPRVTQTGAGTVTSVLLNAIDLGRN